MRRELPRGRAEAFTAAELERFNAGRSLRFEAERLREAVEAAQAAREGAEAVAPDGVARVDAEGAPQ